MLGWSNIELISDRKFEVMLDELKQLKQEYPDRILIASIMACAQDPPPYTSRKPGITTLVPFCHSGPAREHGPSRFYSRPPRPELREPHN